VPGDRVPDTTTVRERLFTGILRLADCEGDVAVFDHMLDLSPHCGNEY
jgi:hypothetical protein